MKEQKGEKIPVWANVPAGKAILQSQAPIFTDKGPEPFVVDIEDATEDNVNFRTTLWTGTHMQLTLMSIDVDDDIGLERHIGTDQFLRIEEGEGVVMMGDNQNDLNFRRRVKEDYAILIPSGKWHNVLNTGSKPLKLYSLYAPPEHARGTIHRTKADDTDHV